jgi:endonuclease/exonuclease/phosphatase family metal-dependent hydrolase
MSLTLATFNLKNLALPGDEIYFSTKPLYSDEDYARKVKWVGERIREMEADVIGFQEVWKIEALEECFRTVGLLDEYDIVGRDAPDRFSVQVAFAVRKGWMRGREVWHEDFPEKAVFKKRKTDHSTYHMTVEIDNFSRPPLEIRVKPKRRGAPEMMLFCSHLKSKRPIELDRTEKDKLPTQDEVAIGSALSTIRRSAEAAALRILLNDRMLGNDRPFVVMGDLNDDYLSVSTTIVTADPSYKLYHASRVGSKASKSGDLGLYSTQMLKEYRSLRNVHYTHIYKNKLEVLDHILVSEQFYDHSPKRIWAFRDSRFWNDHLEKHEESNLTTDHGIVVAEFDYKPLEKVMRKALEEMHEEEM